MEQQDPGGKSAVWAIVERCQAGDREAFHDLFELYKTKVYSTAYYFFGNESAAADATQQVFLKLFHSISQFRNESDFSTWLYRMVINVCVDEQRKVKRLVGIETAMVAQLAGSASQEKAVFSRQISLAIKSAITELNPSLRIPILLRYVEDLSYEEIARTTGCSIGTVASRLNRGHKLLAEKLSGLRKLIR